MSLESYGETINKICSTIIEVLVRISEMKIEEKDVSNDATDIFQVCCENNERLKSIEPKEDKQSDAHISTEFNEPWLLFLTSDGVTDN